jgi:hypothetical protein
MTDTDSLGSSMGRCTDLLTLACRLLADVGWGRTAVEHFRTIAIVSQHVVRVGRKRGPQAPPRGNYQAATGKTRKGLQQLRVPRCSSNCSRKDTTKFMGRIERKKDDSSASWLWTSFSSNGESARRTR